ncbi:MAG: hypothetical protein R6X25_02160 [Candidatus Krumholzibacteriia bacterium]
MIPTTSAARLRAATVALLLAGAAAAPAGAAPGAAATLTFEPPSAVFHGEETQAVEDG